FVRSSDRGRDIWQSMRASVAEPFGPAERLPDEINSEYAEDCPYVSADGLTLWFASNRPGGHGDFDIYVSRRATTAEPFGEPANVGPSINSAADEASPFVTADGLTLLFGRGNPRRIWQSTRKTADEAFGEPGVVDHVNGDLWNEFPRLTADGLILVL